MCPSLSCSRRDANQRVMPIKIFDIVDGPSRWALRARLVWDGNPTHRHPTLRSTPLSTALPAAKLIARPQEAVVRYLTHGVVGDRA